MSMQNEKLAIQSSSALGDLTLLEVPKLLSKEEIKNFSQINNWKYLAAIIGELFTIAFIIWFSNKYWNPLVYCVAVILIGSRIHALAVLMHEATHYRGFSNRWFNDIVGELLAWPTTLTMQGYRNNHFAHHRELNSENDPDWIRKQGREEFVFPKHGRELSKILLRYISGLNFFNELRTVHSVKQINVISSRVKTSRILFFSVLFLMASIFGFWKYILLYWLVPLFSTFLFFAYVRSVAEHFGVEYSHPLNQTRTVTAPFVERWLFAPYGINYHLEHHLYPGIPFFRLHEVHKHLMAKVEYSNYAHITKGYIKGLYSELTSK